MSEGRWVPHLLTEMQKMQRISICSLLLIWQDKDPFLNKIVTGDEKWIQYDNPKRKRQWLSPGVPSKATPKPNMHGKKILLSVWWNVHGIIHFELLKPGKTITAEFYSEQLIRLKDAIQRKHPALTNRNGNIKIAPEHIPQK